MTQDTTSTRQSKKGIILFGCILAALTVLAVLGLFQWMASLNQQLTEYEAAQLENQSAQVFQQLFAEPDWTGLYALSKTEDTAYEGASAYAAYMDKKVDGRALICRETYSPDPGVVHRYQVFLDEEPIAAFTMTGGAASASQLPRWTLGNVELFFQRSISVTVEKKPEYTVYINGVPLDNSRTIYSVTTKAEAYLPEGVHGYRRELQYIDGLLIQPEIAVLDEKGNTVPVAQDSETGVYTLQLPAEAEMTEAEETLARNAAIADAKFSMRGITAAELEKYFDKNAPVYSDIVNNPTSIQKNKGFSIDESAVEVGSFFRFSDNVFCANVKLTVNVTRKDNTLKKYQLDKTYFFTRGDDGAFLVSAYTNQRVLETVEQVRLTFVEDSRQITQMTDVGADTVTLPEVTAPAGQTLVGWATQTHDDSGTVTMTVRILPTGAVLGTLEPMTLYPVFQPEP